MTPSRSSLPPWIHILTLLLWIYIPLIRAEQQRQQQHTSTVIVTTETPSSPQPPSYTSAKDFKDTVLSTSNRYRSEHQAIHLVWNETLTDYALDWAKRCIWKHSHGPYGENLAFGYSNATASIRAWGDERDMYDFREPTGYTEATGHFTQLVWRDTTDVGCAAVDCGYTGEDEEDGRPERALGWYVVCEYSPGGNIIGNDDDEKGKKGRKADWKTSDDEEDPKKKWFRLNVLPAKKRTWPWESSSSSSSLLVGRGYTRKVSVWMVFVHGFFLML